MPVSRCPFGDSIVARRDRAPRIACGVGEPAGRAISRVAVDRGDGGISLVGEASDRIEGPHLVGRIGDGCAAIHL